MDKNEKLLTNVTKQWAAVKKENDSERHLVSENDFASWENFRNSINERLIPILRSDRQVTQEDIEFLETLSSRISEARHVPARELQAKLDEERASEAVAKRRSGRNRLLELLGL